MLFESFVKRHPRIAAAIIISAFFVWTLPIGISQAWSAWVKDKTIPQWLAERRWPFVTAGLYNWLVGIGFLAALALLGMIFYSTRKRKMPLSRERNDTTLETENDGPLSDLLVHLFASEVGSEWAKLTSDQKGLLGRILIADGLNWDQIDDAYWKKLPVHVDPTVTDYLLERSTLLERKSKGNASLASYVAAKKMGVRDRNLGTRTWKVKAEFKAPLEGIIRRQDRNEQPNNALEPKTRSATWNIESQARLSNDLKALANEHTEVNVLMANQQHRPLSELLVSIFDAAGWQAHLTDVPLEQYRHEYISSIQVLGYNKYVVETVAAHLASAGLPGVRTVVNKLKFTPANPKWQPSQHKIEITIGHEDDGLSGATISESKIVYGKGRISTMFGMPLSNVSIIAENKSTGEKYKASSDLVGFWNISLTPGLYLFSIGANKTELIHADKDFEKNFILNG